MRSEGRDFSRSTWVKSDPDAFGLCGATIIELNRVMLMSLVDVWEAGC